MKTMRELSASARSWLSATSSPHEEEWFSFPYLGAPWDHLCADLRSERFAISVVVPFNNSAESLAQCLTSIRFSSLNRLAPHRLEVILCDDGSSDKSWEIAKSAAYGMNVQAYRLPHRSQSAAISFGMDHANGDVVVFCDSDMVLGCGALDELAARHERWADAVCFGFRSNIEREAIPSQPDGLWSLIHAEAFSGDNRVCFDLPTIVPNMLVATRWLTDLDSGRSILDSQGSVWPRHRFVYGCLFSVRLDLLQECGSFPGVLGGWGYSDTLVAARLEASGAFLLPVTSAWGHHIWHDIRYPDQWFQGNRNRLAYEYLLAHPLSNHFWRDLRQPQPRDSFTSRHSLGSPTSHFVPRSIETSPVTLARLGQWEGCLATSGAENDPRVIAECLFRLGKYEEIAQNEHYVQTIWGVLSLHRCGATAEAGAVLRQAATLDAACAYGATASVPELLRLAEHYFSIGIPTVARSYSDLVDIIVGGQ